MCLSDCQSRRSLLGHVDGLLLSGLCDVPTEACIQLTCPNLGTWSGPVRPGRCVPISVGPSAPHQFHPSPSQSIPNLVHPFPPCASHTKRSVPPLPSPSHFTQSSYPPSPSLPHPLHPSPPTHSIPPPLWSRSLPCWSGPASV